MKTITKVATLLAVPFMMATTVNAQNLLDAAMGADQASFEVESTLTTDNSGAAGWKDAKSEGLCFRTTEKAYDGEASMKFAATTDDAVSSGILLTSTKNITMEQNHSYKLSYWIFVEETGNERLSQISVAKSNGWLQMFNTTISEITVGEWVKIESDEILYEGETISTGITIKLFASNGVEGGISCYIDQVEVIDVDAVVEPDVDEPEVEEETDFVLANLGDADQMNFEVIDETSNCGADGWYIIDGSYLCGTRTTEMAQDGDACMMMNLPADDTATTYLQVNTDASASKENCPTFEGGKTYKITYWVYIDSSKCAKLSSVQVGVSTFVTSVKTANIAKDQWVKMESDSITFETTTSVKLVLKSFVNTAYAGTDDTEILYYLDNVQTYVIDENADGTTSIANANEPAIAVAASNGNITIKGAEMGANVEVYAVTGAKVASVVATSNTVSVPLLSSGIYIVKAGNDVVKVAL